MEGRSLIIDEERKVRGYLLLKFHFILIFYLYVYVIFIMHVGLFIGRINCSNFFSPRFRQVTPMAITISLFKLNF